MDSYEDWLTKFIFGMVLVIGIPLSIVLILLALFVR